MVNIKQLNNHIVLLHKDTNIFRLYSNGQISTINDNNLEIFQTPDEIPLAKMYFTFNVINNITDISYSLMTLEECWACREKMKESIIELYNKPTILVAKF